MFNLRSQPSVVTRPMGSVLATNSVIRNTYILLSLTLLFSAVTAGIAMMANAAPMNPILVMLVYFGLIFGVSALHNSAWGIAAVFALTGFMGYTLGPILNMFIQNYSNGSQLVMTALGGTGIIFLSLSAYALTTRKDFSYLAGFLMAASVILLLAVVVGLLFPMPMFQVVVSAGFMLFASGIILFETSQIIHGGQNNYILATVSLYASIYNLFISLLQLLAFFGGRQE